MIQFENRIIFQETTVLFSIDSVHKDSEFWGDPFVYRPERFLDEEGKIASGAGDRVWTFGLGEY